MHVNMEYLYLYIYLYIYISYLGKSRHPGNWLPSLRGEKRRIAEKFASTAKIIYIYYININLIILATLERSDSSPDVWTDKIFFRVASLLDKM